MSQMIDGGIVHFTRAVKQGVKIRIKANVYIGLSKSFRGEE